MKQQMDLERLQEICAAYGHDPRRWPQQERADAEALIATSATARSLVYETASLDQWLDKEPAIFPSPALRARIIATAPQQRQPFLSRIFPSLTASWNGLGGWRLAVPALIAALVLGAALGNSVSPDVLDQSDLLQLAMFQDDPEGY